MASLRTHLLYEAVDIAFAKTQVRFKFRYLDPRKRRFWQLTEPQHACALAISSSHGYKLVDYMLQRHATAVKVEDTVFRCGIRCKYHTVSVLTFSSKYYIRHFIELAARVCTRLQYLPNMLKDEYLSIFLSSLPSNNVCERYEYAHMNPVTHCTIFILPSMYHQALSKLDDALWESSDHHCITTSWKFSRHDGTIPFLGINGIRRPIDKNVFAFLNDQKIETLHILSASTRDCLSDPEPTIHFEIFFRHKPDMEYLKTFRCDYQIYSEYVVTMLKRYKIPNVRMNNVRLPDYVKPLDQKIYAIRKDVSMLWAQMQKYNGNVYVDCKSYQSIPNYWQAGIETVKAEMSDYHISQNASDDVILKMERSSGTKKLVVEIVFFEYDRYHARAPYPVRKRQFERYRYRPY
uniref:Glycosyltransferase family 92 protein n=1 Tax=Panagrellus redivivus TaxID=6233 RepID=A0A7E5A2C5_PANRE